MYKFYIFLVLLCFVKSDKNSRGKCKKEIVLKIYSISSSYGRKGTNGNTVTKLRYGGQQEQPTILISMLLLCMLGIKLMSCEIFILS